MRYLTVREVVTLHAAVVSASGGAAGLRDLGALESALAQPRATFDGVDLYPGVVDKASSRLRWTTRNASCSLLPRAR